MERGFAVIGLGYVGLPMTFVLAKKFKPVIGFDISEPRFAEFREFGMDPMITDSFADPAGVAHEYSLTLVLFEHLGELDGRILAVPHCAFGEAGWEKVFAAPVPDGIFIDVKSAVSRDIVPPGIGYWSL